MAKNKNSLLCTCCGKSQPISKFYISSSYLYKALGYIPVCKDCIGEIYERYKNKYKDDRLTIYNFCRLLDLPYSESSLEGAKQHSEKTGWKLYQSYLKQINSFGDINNVGTCFEEGEMLQLNEISEDNNEEEYIFTDDFEVTPEMKTFWGKGYSDEEYRKLEQLYMELVNNYECDSPVQVMLFKNIAKTQLQADKELEAGNVATYDKLMKTLSTILTDSNIKPVQETGANATEQATFGTLIKKWENEKPIPDPLPEWKKADVLRYVKIWFLGHLSRMLNLDNPFKEEYEEELKKYTIESPFDDEEGDY